jgi:hypothetical protein
MDQPVQWQKSSFSGPGDGNECVEVATGGNQLMLRESDEPSHVLSATPAGLAALIHHVKSGATA